LWERVGVREKKYVDTFAKARWDDKSMNDKLKA